jgi:beta-mannosidase
MPSYQEICLNGIWELHEDALCASTPDAERIARRIEGWIDQPVPGDIHQGLEQAGQIQEPLIGLNSFDCRWTEGRSWWFRKRFYIPAAFLQSDVVELELNGLDANAEIFLNGEHLGSHHSAFYPFSCDVKNWLIEGENSLLVRLSAGVETISEADVAAADGSLMDTSLLPERGEFRRVYARKPAYTFGWDWSPRLATTAIAGNVLLRSMSEACIRQVFLRPEWTDLKDVRVQAVVEVERFHYYQTGDGRVVVSLTNADGCRFTAFQDVLLRSGINYIDLTLSIPEPRLWWPNGMGEQHLYRVEARLETENGQVEIPAFDFGLRFVEIETQGSFAIWVNGERVFCKGADWIPADALYARVSPDRYERLVREARAANFNMLRIWGGGLYEPDVFYQACDRNGILIWHDFMFACSPYPDHLESFRLEVEREAEYQTRRLQRHACMALWCGNNENHWGFRDWWREKTRGGAWIYNHLLPRAVHRNSPEIPYWNSSPYGGKAPNSQEVGDHHLWNQIMMNPEMQKRITPEEYDRNPALFVSEFGYVGACTPETMSEAMGAAPFDIQSKVWQHHTNTFEKNTVLAGIRKHYRDPEGMSMPDYFLYSGLCQGLMLGYALETMRANLKCSGGLFWMYEDCWGEIGWTAIDFGLRRKPSWYFIRRAFASLRIILREAGENHIRAILANDTPQAFYGEMEFGYIALDGSDSRMQRCQVQVPALSRGELVVFPRGAHDPASGLWVARFPGRKDIGTAIFRAIDFRQLKTVSAALAVSISEESVNGCKVLIKSPVYAHAVRLSLPEGCLPEDNFFDLLPGEEREISIETVGMVKPEDITISCANQ